MREHDGLHFDAIGEDASRAAVGMDLFLAIRLRVELRPGPQLFLEGDAFVLQWIERHLALSLFGVQTANAVRSLGLPVVPTISLRRHSVRPRELCSKPDGQRQTRR